jgi:hypothetical protein
VFKDQRFTGWRPQREPSLCGPPNWRAQCAVQLDFLPRFSFRETPTAPLRATISSRGDREAVEVNDRAAWLKRRGPANGVRDVRSRRSIEAQRRKYQRLLRRLKPFDVWLSERPRSDADVAIVRRLHDEIRRQAQHPDPIVVVSLNGRATFLK